jgi:hypothetical protein
MWGEENYQKMVKYSHVLTIMRRPRPKLGCRAKERERETNNHNPLFIITNNLIYKWN